MDDRKNLPEHEVLIRRVSATPQNQFAEFTEKKLLYRETMRHSIRSGETTYARPTDYDRTLAILFPALRVRLESGKATQFAVEKINRTKA